MKKYTLSKNWNEIKETRRVILIDIQGLAHNLKYIKNYGYYIDDNWESYNFDDFNLQLSLKQYYQGFLKAE